VLASDERIDVRREAGAMTFAARDAGKAASLILLPGSMVEPTAYAPLLRSIAEAGYEATLLELPLRTAPLESQRRVPRDHAELLDGLVLIGTSHPRDFDLSGLTIDVTKVFASNDGLATPAEVKANARRLPPQTRWVNIEGGNHSQFGYYGFQLGDRRATISREAQQSATRQALLDALSRVATDGRN
jgi:pimeloyl-ACP methyl ester carboxylesterase